MEVKGILMSIFPVSSPPASSNRTEYFPLAERRFATTQPAEPAPTATGNN